MITVCIYGSMNGDSALGKLEASIPAYQSTMDHMPTWRIIPLSKWLITMVSRSPK